MGTDLWAHDAGISVKESAEGIMKVVSSLCHKLIAKAILFPHNYKCNCTDCRKL